MESILMNKLALGFLLVSRLISGQSQAREGDASVTLRFEFQLQEKQSVHSIIWSKIMDGSSRNVAIYDSGTFSPVSMYQGRAVITKTPWQIELLNVTLSDAGQYQCDLTVKDVAWMEEFRATNTLQVLGLHPTTTPQVPPPISGEQSKDSAFENSLMSTITFSSICTTAALATLFLFVTIALCCRRRRRQRRRLENSYASLTTMCGRSGDTIATTPSCHVTDTHPGGHRGCSGLDPARRPLPLIPACGRERPPCPLRMGTRQGETNVSESTGAAYCISSVVCPQGASFGSHNPPPRCGLSRQLPPPPSTSLIQSYLEVDREPREWNRTPSVMDSHGSALHETTV